MEENAIKPGDVVKLKSGGPAMTVAWVDEEEQAECHWFSMGRDFTYTHQKREFSVSQLKHCEPSKSLE